MHNFPATRPSLLVRLRDEDDDKAWSEFVDIYAPLVYRFARRRGMQDADAADVMQDSLKTCSQSLPHFRYDRSRGSFRAWLFAVVRTRLCNHVARQRRQPHGQGGSDFQWQLQQYTSPSRQERDEWTREYELHLIDWAQSRIRHEFRERTWRAFQLTAIDGLPAKEVAAQLHMTTGAVYVAKTRVLQRLKQCIHDVDDQSSWLEHAV